MTLNELKTIIKDNISELENGLYLSESVADGYGGGLSDYINEVIDVLVDGKTIEVMPFECERCGGHQVYYSMGGGLIDSLHDDDKIVYTSDGDVCDGCFMDYSYCEGCNEYHHRDYGVIDSDGYFWCDRCSNDSLFYCAMCNEYYDRNQHTSYYIEDEGETICEHCRENTDVICCAGCGDYYAHDYQYNEERDEYFCDNCYPHYVARISDQLSDQYSNTSEIITFDTNELNQCDNGRLCGYHDYNRSFVKYHSASEDSNALYMGVELEVEDHRQIKHKMARYLNQKNVRCVIASDGSLNDGMELVSDPQTISVWNSRKETIHNLLNFLTINDFKSHDTTTCGLHIHASRKALGNNAEEISDTIARIDLLLESFKDNIIAFSRRKESELSRWARFVSDYTSDKKSVYSTELLKINKRTGDRYQALNLDNEHTIEFRFFKGTLKPTTFLASIQLVNNIIEICKNADLFNNTLKWADIINLNGFEELKAYNESLHQIDNKKALNDRTISIRREQEKKDKKALKKAYIQKIKLDEIIDFLDINAMQLIQFYHMRNNYDYTLMQAVRNPLTRTDESNNIRVTNLIMEIGALYTRLINYKNDYVKTYRTLNGVNHNYYESDTFKTLCDYYEDLKTQFQKMQEKGVI